LLRKKPGFPLQVLGFAHTNPAGFPLQSLAPPSGGHPKNRSAILRVSAAWRRKGLQRKAHRICMSKSEDLQRKARFFAKQKMRLKTVAFR
jgi:hypothetical protein